MINRKASITLAVVFLGLALLLIAVGFSGVNSAPTSALVSPAVQTPRPVPPDIMTYDIFPSDDGSDGQPAACHGQPGCRVRCYYVNMTPDHGYVISCLPWAD
ncbi:MAG: hypothetical protein KJ063_02140 [Anaerolineae bacterium]|nr:hypothetical protein [Anaerolineae bacterium]